MTRGKRNGKRLRLKRRRDRLRVCAREDRVRLRRWARLPPDELAAARAKWMSQWTLQVEHPPAYAQGPAG